MRRRTARSRRGTTIGNTRLNVDMGLASGILVRDAQERNWIASSMLPDPGYEMPLVLQDRRLAATGRLACPRRYDDTFFGDVMLVNGKARSHLEVEPRNCTLQLGTDSDNWVLQQIGTDGGFLPAPLSLRRITLAPGERADVIVDFSQPRMSNGVVLMNMDMDPMHMAAPPIDEVMEFRVGGSVVNDNVTRPAILASISTAEHRYGDAPLLQAGGYGRRECRRLDVAHHRAFHCHVLEHEDHEMMRQYLLRN